MAPQARKLIAKTQPTCHKQAKVRISLFQPAALAIHIWLSPANTAATTTETLSRAANPFAQNWKRGWKYNLSS